MQSTPRPPSATENIGIREQVKQRRPGEIVNAAYEEFMLKGYAATRLEDVARRIGVTKGTIYIYFQSKEEVFRAVIGALVTPILDRAAEFKAQFAGTCADLLRHHIEGLYRDICAEPRGAGLLRLLIAEGEKFPELVDFYHREVAERAIKIVREILAQGIASGEFRSDAPVAHPEIYIAPVMMLALDKMMHGEKSRAHATAGSYLEAHIKLVLAALHPTA
jgi:AcrR family transcriptional regulator